MSYEDRVYLAMIENFFREGKTEKQIEKIIATVKQEDEKEG